MMVENSIPKFKLVKFWQGAVFGLVIAFFFLIFPISEQLKKYHLLPEPERLTELYFEDHLNLPNKVELGKTQSFKFTIHNLEYETTRYIYEVTASDEAGQVFKLDTGATTLRQDAYQTVAESYLLATASGRTMIQVKLVNQNQPIHFWLEK